MAREYDTFILEDPATVPEDQELELVVRELTPDDRRYKYRSFYAKALISKSESKYSDILKVRLGRGQLLDTPWSIELIKEVSKF